MNILFQIFSNNFLCIKLFRIAIIAIILEKRMINNTFKLETKIGTKIWMKTIMKITLKLIIKWEIKLTLERFLIINIRFNWKKKRREQKESKKKRNHWLIKRLIKKYLKINLTDSKDKVCYINNKLINVLNRAIT